MSETRKPALSYALSALGRRRYTKAQLARKLEERGYESAVIEKVFEYCEERQYLNDYEFARMWVEDRIRLKPMGRWRLKQELRQKGVDESIIESILLELLPLTLELALARQLMMQRLEQVQGRQKGFYKVISFLMRRGFSPQLIYQVAEELGLDFGEDDQT